MALYKIDKKNVLTTNPANADFAIPAGEVGSSFPNVARHSANVLLVSSFKVGAASASIGGGASHVGKRMGDVAASSSFGLPAYTTVKLVAAYTPYRKLRIALHIDNLFNKACYASSYNQVWVAPGTERAATLTASYSF